MEFRSVFWVGGVRVLVALLATAVVSSAFAVFPPPAAADEQTQSGQQTEARVTLRAGYRDLTVVAEWVNRKDADQDGSRARPFLPGSSPELRIEVSGFDPPPMVLATGGLDSVSLGGAAAGMSMGLSNRWNLTDPTSDLWAPRKPSGVGFLSIDIRPTSVAGGLATWSMSKATLSFADGFGGTTTAGIPALSGSFWIAPSDDPAIEGVTVSPERSAEIDAARELMEQRGAELATALDREDRKQARADRLVPKYRKALRAYKDARSLHEKAFAAHRKAAAEAGRLAEQAEGKGRKAQARADRAAAKADRLSDRVADRAAAMEQAQETMNKAKWQADGALDEAKDAVTLARYAEQRLLEATADYEALLKKPTGG